MIDNLPRNVFSFLYLMWGGVRHRYVTFLTPKKMENEKKDLIALKADCEAIIWILEHQTYQYGGRLAKTYTTKEIVYFAASTAVIFCHEKVFELCDIEFDSNLLPADIDKVHLLKFYVDQPKNMNVIKFLYRNYSKSENQQANLDALHEMVFTHFENIASEIFDTLNLVSHYDPTDYAIALQDYNNPQKAEAFFNDLKMVLSRVYSDKRTLN